LNVIPIEVPPLRERPMDIPIMVHRFAQRTAEENAREFQGVNCEALDMLVRDPWPGYVRELQHAVERAVILGGDPLLTPKSFGFLRSRATQADDPANQSAPSGPVLTLSSFDLAEAEAVLIERALEATGDNRTRAAKLLGISVRTLRSKLNAPPTDEPEEDEPSLDRDEIAWKKPASRGPYPGKSRLH
jgi:DNA-binding NtrC family response regulator